MRRYRHNNPREASWAHSSDWLYGVQTCRAHVTGHLGWCLWLARLAGRVTSQIKQQTHTHTNLFIHHLYAWQYIHILPVLDSNSWQETRNKCPGPESNWGHCCCVVCILTTRPHWHSYFYLTVNWISLVKKNKQYENVTLRYRELNSIFSVFWHFIDQ